jgi:DNA-binding GntR family transcriptional regulator
VESLYRALREQILEGALPEGAALSQVKLASEFGVNRTPLREALRMLQREGLVEAEYNRRVRVTPLTTVDLEGLYAERIITEALGTRLSIPTLTDADFFRLRGLIEQMRSDALAGELVEWENGNRAFHRGLVSGGVPRVTARVDDLSDLARRYRRALAETAPQGVGGFVRGERDHLEIVEACEARNPDRAGGLIARHLAQTALSLISLRDPTYDPGAIREAQLLIGIPAP